MLNPWMASHSYPRNSLMLFEPSCIRDDAMNKKQDYKIAVKGQPKTTE